ncbi:hypothetical protein Psuf_081370 [Phytohabitans suffuscus]|uniref:Polysaccharide chain length determinant N-terminal domain-containing protein n=1 Tax=Phytohabitans suffuscus TaxID=624315 RepID=A0A6F8YXP3_9ACTN|nr:Wzz/FepE/Etk N-terminal domain-containing protein [Phytohabitans suffuscus]BCB90824.1 hypothetical protein Psuf_081370 [Phytohabitans suffuscus]
MEIVDYLRIARRRLWVLLGVPLAAALAVGLFIGLSPQRYTATGYVAAPALVGGAASQQYTGTQAASQFVAAFKAAVTSPRVLDQVAADTGVATGALRDGLAVAQVGASSQLTLTYTAAQRATVEPVLTATARRALDFLFSSQVNIATEQVQAASADVTSATAAIADWEKANKVSQPDKLYQATLTEIANLRQQKLSMEAVGNSRAVAAATSALDAAQKRLDALGPKLPDYQSLLAQRDAATSALSQARQGLQGPGPRPRPRIRPRWRAWATSAPSPGYGHWPPPSRPRPPPGSCWRSCSSSCSNCCPGAPSPRPPPGSPRCSRERRERASEPGDTVSERVGAAASGRSRSAGFAGWRRKTSPSAPHERANPEIR